LGDKVRVKAVRVDLARRQMDLCIVEPPKETPAEPVREKPKSRTKTK
jgi:hypothetical protein